MYCKNCGKEINDNAVVCVNCGAQVEPIVTDKSVSNINDKPSIALNVLSFIFPLIGLILFLCMRGDTPLTAKACGKWALISVAVAAALYILFFLFIFGVCFLKEIYCCGDFDSVCCGMF